VLLFNPQTDTPVTHRIVDAANAAGIPVVEVRETLPAGSDVLSWQRQTVDQLGAALQRIDNRKS
jgi:zinc/manganese transport system substrate-binding protein